ncbi:MAG: lytic murein transglycosylase, partial [Xanthobacteraceae bacterium]
MDDSDSRMTMTRRRLLQAAAGASALFAAPAAAFAAPADFDAWRNGFEAKARSRGISDQTYRSVLGRIEPDMSVFAKMRKQPEFHEQVWQYINRRVSDWRLIAGKEALRKNQALFAHIEKDFGVERGTLLALWGVESAYGDPLVQQNHMRPVFPSLAALAWREPRRRTYWETELINALKIVQRGWSTPAEMRGSWAGAMGHTQWMPEVWLNVGFDYDGDGRVSPFGKPDDALGSTARYLVKRGKYHRNEHWGYEVRAPGASAGSRSYAAWASAGVTRADGRPFPHSNATAKLWTPMQGGPSFLLGPNFYSVRSYNPSMNYALAICHLGDRILGAGPFIHPFPGSERALTLAEIQEV